MRIVTTFAEAVALGPGEYGCSNPSLSYTLPFMIPALEPGEYYSHNRPPHRIDGERFVRPPVVAARADEIRIHGGDWCRYIEAADPSLVRHVTDGFARSPATLAPWWALEIAIFIPSKSRARASQIIRMARDATPDDRAALRAMLGLSTQPADKRRMIYAWAKVVRAAQRRGGAC